MTEKKHWQTSCKNCKWDRSQKIVLPRPDDKKRVCRTCIYRGSKEAWEPRTSEQLGVSNEYASHQTTRRVR